MVPMGRILRDYRASGSVSSLVNLWGFVDGTTFLTKSGGLGQVFRLRGVDADCLDHEERREVVLQYERALRLLDESFRVYQYLLKRPSVPLRTDAHPDPVVQEILERRAIYFEGRAAQLFEIELYLVVIYEGWTGRAPSTGSASLAGPALERLRALFGRRHVTAAMAAQLDRAATHLQQKAEAFALQLADSVVPTVLSKGEAFRFFRQLLNLAPAKVDVPLVHDTHLDFYAADSGIECYRDHLVIDGYRTKVLTMKDPPTRTFAHMLEDLCALPTAFMACLEWQRLPAAQVRRDLRNRRRHFFNTRVSLLNYLSPHTRPEDMLVDEAATATVSALGQALAATEIDGHFFGACAFSIVLYDQDATQVDRHVASCTKAFAGHDGALYEESYNLLNAYLAIVPGNSAHSLRRLQLLNTNAADLSLLFTLQTGDRTSPHLGGRPCLAVFETNQQTPYFWNLHHGDVGHTLIQGATGSGKSFLANFLLAHAQRYDPVTVIFDLGGSYEALVAHLGGSRWKLGVSQQTFTINPFCLPPTQEHLHFLFSFVRVLVQSTGQYQLTLTDDRDLYDAVESVYALDPPQRRLITLANILPRPLAQPLHRWVQGGPYAALFDNAEDTLTFGRVQCFDFEGLEAFPLVLEPLLFYILHRSSATIQDRTASDQLKVFLLDEAWRFARAPTVKAYITEALKTWRKRNAAMILATQSSDDFVDRDLLRTVVESCPTKFFLANPGMDVARARDLFHLNHTEATRITTLRPRQQALVKRPGLSKVINVNVDAASCRLFSSRGAASEPRQEGEA